MSAVALSPLRLSSEPPEHIIEAALHDAERVITAPPEAMNRPSCIVIMSGA